MKIKDALKNITSLAIDTAPIIYYVENHPTYANTIQVVIDFADDRLLNIIVSNLLMMEVLVQPLRLNNTSLATEYENALLNSANFSLMDIGLDEARKAAELRASYNLKTPDALHVATAIVSGADAFLTNDIGIKRVTDIPILILDELEL